MKTKKINMDTCDNSKMAGRRENRASAMQFLYMREMSNVLSGDALEEQARLDAFFEMKDKPRSYYSFAEELIAGALAHMDDVDSLIQKYAKNWSLDRIARVDLAILRLAVFELLYRDDIPPVVSINEAIDLAKTYSSGESRRFINGILDSVKGTLKRPLRAPNVKK